MKYDTEIHHCRSIRLKGYDYTQIGLYYITLCCQNRECIFGEIFNGEMVLNEYGKIVDKCWRDLPIHYQNIQLDYFVIMPNHFHGIVIIDTIVGAGFKPALTNTDKPAPTNHGLSEFIRALKTFSSKQINQIRNTPGISVWQRNFYEHIIRDEKSLENIRNYIVNNPADWDDDENNITRIEKHGK